MRPRRSLYEILWEILVYCREPRRLTHIMLHCNLDTRGARRYLELLARRGLIERRGERYVTTDKGLEYIELFNELYRRVFADQ